MAGRTDTFAYTVLRPKAISKTLMGHPVSIETRKKISRRVKEAMASPELREKLSKIHKKRCMNPEYREKMGNWLRGRKPTLETRQKMSLAQKKRWEDPTVGKQHSDAMKKYWETHPERRHRSAETIRKMSVSLKRLWQNKEYKERMIKILRRQHIRPNIPERKLIKIIRDNNFPFIYVGDGKVVIEGFCPDFIDNDGSKRIIEVFGDYWHRLPKVMKRDEKRLETFRKYGFKTLVIWESELKDEEQMTSRIKEAML